MSEKKKTKLDTAKKQAIVSSGKRDDTERREFGKEDILKHYIRKYYWKERINKLKRAVRPDLNDGIKYFSLCSKYAFDVRLFINEGLINPKNTKKLFTFCENEKEDFELLNSSISIRLLNNVIGFDEDLAEIANDTHRINYGKFWGTFPFDVINLDYYGDIFKAKFHKIGVNDFYAIQAIIFQQSRLRRQYELWITWRAVYERTDPPAKQTFKDLIIQNRNDYKETFGMKFSEIYPEIERVSRLDNEKLFYIGYLKWLWFSCRSSFSVINPDKIEILKYTRTGKNGNKYNLYNILLRIMPYGNVTIPSPAGEAANYCKDEYENGIISCFNDPIDIDEKYKRLSIQDKKQLKDELKSLNKDFEEDKKGYFL